jgi:KaiC/GvpD/RAD55 family RecA-like ATPase
MNKKSKPGGWRKIPTGMASFDVLTGGGLPSNRTTLVLGGPGSGKTVFALQALVHSARGGQPGIFVSFNETPQQLVENAAGFGWDLEALQQNKLTLLDARMRPSLVRAGHFDLMGMLAGLRAVAAETGARHLVFDSLDVLLTLLDDRLLEVQEVFRLRDWLSENGFSAILTANLEASEPRTLQRHYLMQTVADCSVTLALRADKGTLSRHLRVVKYRGSGFTEAEAPFTIGASGIEVQLPRSAKARRAGSVSAVLHPEIALARQELSARVQEMDRFLEMKQAELNFLLEKESVSGERRPAARRAGKAPGKALPKYAARAKSPARPRPRNRSASARSITRTRRIRRTIVIPAGVPCLPQCGELACCCSQERSWLAL